MSIAVNIVTTSNIARRFTQTDDASIKEILENLRRSGQLFSNRNLIIGSANETGILPLPRLHGSKSRHNSTSAPICRSTVRSG